MATGKTIGAASTSGNPAEVALALQMGGGALYAGSYTIAQTAATTVFVPNAIMVNSARVSAGSAAAGSRIVSDGSATASSTVVKSALSVSAGVVGTLLTFEDTVSAGVVTALFCQPIPAAVIAQIQAGATATTAGALVETA